LPRIFIKSALIFVKFSKKFSAIEIIDEFLNIFRQTDEKVVFFSDELAHNAFVGSREPSRLETEDEHRT